jgi:hypothetical protein
MRRIQVSLVAVILAWRRNDLGEFGDDLRALLARESDGLFLLDAENPAVALDVGLIAEERAPRPPRHRPEESAHRPDYRLALDLTRYPTEFSKLRLQYNPARSMPEAPLIFQGWRERSAVRFASWTQATGRDKFLQRCHCTEDGVIE